MDVLDVIMQRRSVRKYCSDPIPDPVLEEIVRAATYAPSGMNTQPWFFAVARTPEKMLQTRAVMSLVAMRFSPLLQEHFKNHPEMIAETNQFLVTLGNAPACVLVFANQREDPQRDNTIESVSAAIENLLLAAQARGIGSCWIAAPCHVGCGPLFEECFAPGHGEFVAAVTLGYSAEKPNAPKRKVGRYTFI